MVIHAIPSLPFFQVDQEVSLLPAPQFPQRAEIPRSLLGPPSSMPRLGECCLRTLLKDHVLSDRFFRDILCEVMDGLKVPQESRKEYLVELTRSACFYFKIEGNEMRRYQDVIVAGDVKAIPGHPFLRIVQLLFAHLLERARQFGYKGEAVQYRPDHYIQLYQFLVTQAQGDNWNRVELFESLAEGNLSIFMRALFLVLEDGSPVKRPANESLPMIAFLCSISMEDFLLFSCLISRQDLTQRELIYVFSQVLKRSPFLYAQRVFETPTIQQIPIVLFSAFYLVSSLRRGEFRRKVALLFRQKEGIVQANRQLLQLSREEELVELQEILEEGEEEPRDESCWGWLKSLLYQISS